LEVRGTLRGRTLKGSLRAIGGGDPNISDRFFPEPLDPLLSWADSLKRLGIDTVRGRVEVSDTFFTGPRRPEAWRPYHFDSWYGAEVSALSFNDNCFALLAAPGEKAGSPAQLSVIPNLGFVRAVSNARTVPGRKHRLQATLHRDSNVVTVTGRIGMHAPEKGWILPVRDPPAFFRAAFLRALELRGITLREDSAAASDSLLKVYRFTTAPLIALVEETNQRSQNLHAELLLRQLGKRALGDGSSRGGIRAEKEFLAKLGLDSAAFDLHDGCGLSHDNRLKPRELALLLARMARHRYAKDYLTSLASPGLDGATGRRLRDFVDADLIRYKTGSISGTQGLSGYVFGANGDTLSVVMLINGFRGSPKAAENLVDSLFSRTALWYNQERPDLAAAFKLLGRPDAPSGYLERLPYFSRALEGRPYFLGPTGEGRYGAVDPRPPVDLERFDCVTYIESTLGLALARNPADVVPAVLPIRYRGDTLSYATRNHFFVGDWIANNPRWFRVLRTPGDTLVRKVLHRKKLLAAKGLKSSGEDSAAEIAYLPYDKALQLAGEWNLGELFLGVAFVTSIAGLDVTHTGFLEARTGKPPLLRHAGQTKGAVVAQDFKEYLQSRKGKCAGVLFFEFLDPAGE
jgi:D-alanyl-D-alanine carboxypeptidase/D-alanyl-D-alanine-endopeptidase (penicillin-binding protein 4)